MKTSHKMIHKCVCCGRNRHAAEMRFRHVPFRKLDEEMLVTGLIAFCEDNEGCRNHGMGVKALKPMKEHRI